jgi:hypothetical protein
MMGKGFLDAHTSPLYIDSLGSDLLNKSDAIYLLTLLEGTIMYLETLGTKLHDERNREMITLLKESQHKLKKRVEIHSYK